MIQFQIDVYSSEEAGALQQALQEAMQRTRRFRDAPHVTEEGRRYWINRVVLLMDLSQRISAAGRLAYAAAQDDARNKAQDAGRVWTGPVGTDDTTDMPQARWPAPGPRPAGDNSIA